MSPLTSVSASRIEQLPGQNSKGMTDPPTRGRKAQAYSSIER